MKQLLSTVGLVYLPFAFWSVSNSGSHVPQFIDLLHGNTLAEWVNVNTTSETWRMKDNVLICSGHPIGVMRSQKEYENFVLHIEWMHTEPGGNSGVFVWSNARPDASTRLPNGVEVQMLELDWVNLKQAQRCDTAHRLCTRRTVWCRRCKDRSG